MCRFKIPIMLGFFVFRVSSSGPLKYHNAKNIVKQLEKIPPLTDDPFNEVFALIDKVLNKIGLGQALNGNQDTNQARVQGPVKVTRPPISEAIYYYYYAIISTCESSLERWDCEYCRKLGSHIKVVTVYTNPYYHSKWYVAIDDKRQEIILCFRPAFNVGSVFVAFTAILEPLYDDPKSEIMIHSGFQRVVLADFEMILGVLKKVTKWHPTFKLVITGLSLGAGMSAVTTFFLKYRNSLATTSIELFTYGEPRCGNRAFADYMNNLSIPIARVVNGDDVAVRIAAAALGYYHHHNELFILDDGNGNRSIRYCTTEHYEAPECAQSRGPSLLVTQVAFQIIDHIVYFGINSGSCVLSSPIEFFLQLIWPLRSLIPVNLLDQIPTFAIDSNLLLDFRYLVTGGIRNLYKVASQSSTYYNNNVE